MFELWIRECVENSVDLELAKGKIVVCDTVIDATEVVAVKGAVGIIMQDDSPMDGHSYPIPASHVDSKSGAVILSYINSTNR